MIKVLTTLGASVVALGALLGGVEAKTVFYEINGQRYSYDTNSLQQTATARKRIEAAKAAEAAMAQAAAERASNPLVAIFGSQTQREAAADQTHYSRSLQNRRLPANANRLCRPPMTTVSQNTPTDRLEKPASKSASR